jgi:hypothetical protein
LKVDLVDAILVFIKINLKLKIILIIISEIENHSQNKEGLMIPLLLFLACGNKDTDTGEIESDTDSDAEMYKFSNADGVSTVSYPGQIFRHALISELKSWTSDLTDNIDNGTYQPGTAQDVIDDVHFYVDFDSSVGGEVELSMEGTLQATFNDISSNKNLLDKLAGNDSATDHQNWTRGDFVGWEGAASPEDLLNIWIGLLADQVVARVGGDTSLDEAYLTAEGHDLNQLIQKFLLGAITFQQGADDYLDDDVAEKGLNSDHTATVEDKAYTALEHSWDEGFGYFGAAQNYSSYTDVEISDGDSIDLDGDGLVDLKSEKNWGNSVNAGKRDKGAVAVTDFTADAWSGFYDGRKLIDSIEGELNAEDMTALQGHRDQAIMAWENAIAATVIHYINDTLQDMNKFGTSDYSFSTHAKHWGELKGFALGFQFNPRSPMSDADFATFHGLLGDAPVLEASSQADIDAYVADLITARDLMGSAYSFDVANLGDGDGENGW